MRVSRKKLDVLRAQAGFRTWSDFAQACGIFRQQFYLVMGGRTDPHLSTLNKIVNALRARGLEVSVDDILEEDEEKAEAPAVT